MFFFLGVIDSVSSPEASREDGCCNCSVLVEGLMDDESVVRFLFPAAEPADDGEDITATDGGPVD